jgi:hypothetical protein
VLLFIIVEVKIGRDNSPVTFWVDTQSPLRLPVARWYVMLGKRGGMSIYMTGFYSVLQDHQRQ